MSELPFKHFVGISPRGGKHIAFGEDWTYARIKHVKGETLCGEMGLELSPFEGEPNCERCMATAKLAYKRSPERRVPTVPPIDPDGPVFDLSRRTTYLDYVGEFLDGQR